MVNVDRLRLPQVFSAHRLEARLGGGGFGSVYRAYRLFEGEPLGRPVAIKFLSPEVLGCLKDPLRELRVASDLDHPNLIRLIAAGTAIVEDETGRRASVIWFSTELAEGTLRSRLDEEPLSERDVAEILCQTATALAYLHDCNYVHRDIKPDNILLAKNAWKLGDFGLTRAVAGGTSTQLVGTLDYLPPEALASDSAPTRAWDVWALGITAIEAALGTHPRRLCTKQEWLLALTGEPLRCLDRLPGLGRLVGSCLAADPAERPTARAIAQHAADLRAVLNEGPCRLHVGELHAGFRIVSQSPDGRFFVASDHRRTRVLDAVSGREVCDIGFRGIPKTTDVIWFDQAEVVAVIHEKGITFEVVKACDLRFFSASLRRLVKGHPHWFEHAKGMTATQAAYRSNGRWLATGADDGKVIVSNPDRVFTLDGHTKGITAIAFSPSADLVATASWDETVRLWSTADRSEIARCEGHRGRVRALAFSPDGHLFATASSDETIRLWNPVNGEAVCCLPRNEGVPLCLAFSPDGGVLAAGSTDATVRVWDAHARKPPRELRGHDGPVYFVAFSPDGATLVTASDDGTVRRWNMADAAECNRIRDKGMSRQSVTRVAFSEDGRRLFSASCGAGRTGLVRARDSSLLHEVLRIPEKRVRLGRGNQRYLPIWHDNDVLMLHLASGVLGEDFKIWNAFDDDLYCIGPEGDIVARVYYQGMPELFVRSPEGGSERIVRHRSDLEDVTVWDLAFSPNGRYLAAAMGDGMARVWDVPALDEIACLDAGDTCTAVTFMPDSRRLVAGTANSRLLMWDTARDTLEWRSAWAEASERATEDDDEPRWSMSGGAILSIDASPLGFRIAAGGSRGLVGLWDAETGTLLHADTRGGGIGVRVSTAEVRSVAFCPEGRTLACGTDDGTISMVDVETATVLATIYELGSGEAVEYADNMAFWHSAGGHNVDLAPTDRFDVPHRSGMSCRARKFRRLTLDQVRNRLRPPR